MRNLIFGLIATVFLSTFTFGQTLTESALIKLGDRVLSKDGDLSKSAITFTIMNYNKEYKILNHYAINGVDFVDDGSYNDLKADDGIYTFVELLPALKGKVAADSYFVGDDFKHWKAFETAKIKITIKCKIRHIYTGTTILGFSCDTPVGCIEYYDCTAEVSFEW